jgi:hypothetical protein
MANNNTNQGAATAASGGGTTPPVQPPASGSLTADPAALAPKKTTPDEGKTFDRDMEFECVQDCYLDMARWRKGAVRTGRKCPPFFIAHGKAPETDG